MTTESENHSHSAVRALVGVAALVVVLTGVKLAADFLIPILLAFFIAVLSFPMVRFLRVHRCPRWLAVIATLLVDFAVLVGIGFLFSSLAQDFQVRWELFYEERLRTMGNDSVAWAEDMLVKAGVEDASQRVTEIFNVDNVMSLAKSNVGLVAGKLAGFLQVTFIVLLLMVFMLTEGRAFSRKMPKLKGMNGPDFSQLGRSAKDIQKYLAIKTGVSMATGFFAWLLCFFLDLDFPLLWGIVAFAFNYIPAIGSIIAAIPPALLAVIQHGFPEAMVVLAGYLLINMVWGNLIEPTLMGQRFGISTLVVLLSVMFWGFIFGPVGMFLAVPLTMMVKVVLDNSKDLKWLSYLLEKESTTPRIAKVLANSVIEEQDQEAEDQSAPAGSKRKKPVSVTE
ncbi:AI-2E family transporter [Sulfuriroseicoccus oceanibius]|uniref:AI-2E family transporter n=1 Tax=Sulfuriroseicoccus oceanibius TaxID=2707525 RepID=A0A6B3L7F0_9BACT|nr:AI-2E family transporter [Sulfuriroseicoccus oceanibius]QQL45896.1 AI-2E family transporter [Sulfuriroseicoccus oceanibius]